MTSARTLLETATARLASAGVATPRVDSELLLAHHLEVPRSRLALVDDVLPDVAEAFEADLVRRERREPLQYIVGHAPFRYVELSVGPGVFVPRPESELLIDAVLPAIGPGATVVDLCAGSGALAVSLAHETPAGRVLAVESDAAALVWLRRNAEGNRVEVVHADITSPALLAELSGRADAVVCNPPYVPSGQHVQPEVQADPPVAVFAGSDGLDAVPHVIARAAQLLKPGGVFAMEHDDSHGQVVPQLLRDDGRWREIADHADLTGRPRYVVAFRR